MLKIGLTGGIASGKSTVSNWLKKHHYPLIDADRISREIVRPGEEGLLRITEVFGREMLQQDGTLDRSRLGALIFNRADLRRQLNGILHPLIRERMNKELDSFEQKGERVAFLDIPLLFEGGLDQWTDKTIVVDVTKENQLSRLMARNGLTKEQAAARIKAQMPLEEKKKRATAVIDNNGTVAHTEAQLICILKQWGLL